MPEITLAEARAMADRNEPLPEDFYIDTNAEVQWKPGRELLVLRVTVEKAIRFIRNGNPEYAIELLDDCISDR